MVLFYAKVWFALTAAAGELAAKVPLEAIGREWKNPYYQMMRPDLHQELRRVMLDPTARGPMPEMVLGAKISELDVDAGIVHLEDGHTYQGDVLIGADGTHSITRTYVQPDATIKPWGKSCYRWLLPRETLLADPETRPLFEDEGYFGESTGVDRRIVWYPCRDNMVVNFAAFVPDSESNAEGADYDQLGSKALLTKAFSKFHVGERKVLEYAGDDLSVWDLYNMEEMPCWYKGKLVLMGDSAHPFLPFMGTSEMSASLTVERSYSLMLRPRRSNGYRRRRLFRSTSAGRHTSRGDT